ncbi:echinoderm microtubule-associated protein-like CG42247 isoform X2 [Mytilus edulis]|uniref:echinoderm microtubule-associated protein-like CG42247 isoform X2 n=1 Tax=Mytilus edulis TaxID=6550 RepID=UPI0039EF7268
MDYSFQIDTGDRKKSHVMPNPNVYLKRYSNSYAERYKKGRQRQRPSKEKSSRRLHGSEEDLVKTGSEDGDDLDIEKQIELARKARPKRAERQNQIMKEELIYTKQRNNYAMNNKENKEEFYRPRNRTAEEPKHVYKNSLSPVSNKSFPLRGVPMQPYVYPPSSKNGGVPMQPFVYPPSAKNGDVPMQPYVYPPSATNGEIHFSPKFFNMYQVQENIHENEPQETTFVKNEEIEEVRNGAKSYEQMREEARSKRISILTRAEKLVENISRSDQCSTDDEIKIDKPKHRRKKHSKREEKSRTEAKFIQTKDISSSSDEDKYVLVKTTVSPEPPENVNLELPRFIQPSEYQSNVSLHSNEKSELQVVQSDDEDVVYQEQRPATEVYMSQNHVQNEMKRYETVGGTKKEDLKKGRRVTFFRNGDTNFRGISISISQNDFRNFETLLVFLNGKIPTTAGVRYVFSLPDGKEIKSVTEFKHGKAYLASSVKKPNIKLPYGYSRETDWTSARPSPGKVRKDEVHLFKRPTSPTSSPTRKARVITVENNLRKELKEKVIIDPQTKQNFEDILCIIGDLINMNVDSLYTRRKPFRKVVSFSQLFREFKNHDMFIACQEGEDPTDRNSYHGSNNSDKLQSIDELNMSGSSNSDSPPPMENGFSTSRSDNNLEDDSASVLINGKIRRYYPPSMSYPDDEAGKPDRKLKLEWIYGYHAKENSSNLFVLSSGEIAYAVASVVVLYKYIRNKDKDRDSVKDREDTQRLYLGHTEEVTSMALNPTNKSIASAQMAGKENKAHIRVWDCKTLTTLNVIGVGFFDSGILSINFSQQSNGSFLCVMDNAEKHVLSIWDWQKERMVAKTTTSNLAVKAACFYKYNDTILITYGQQHVYFWKLFWDPVRDKEGRIMRDKRSGLFVGDIPNEVCSLAFSAKGDVLTGDSSGTITVWSPDVEYIFSINLDLSETMKNAHKHPVSSLYMLMDNTLMTGGGLEIRAWDSINGYRPANARVLPEATGHVRTIIPQNSASADGRLYIGTSKGYVLDGSLQDKFRFLIQGHSEEIWAIAPHPNESAFFTTSFDKMVIKWSTTRHKIIWKSQIGKPGCCLSADLKGRQVAAGTQTGNIEILNAHNGMHVASIDVSKYRIDCISFSPDSTMIAVGSHDGLLHILDAQDGGQGYSPSRPLKGHPTFVTHIDWSGDSKYIQSTDGQYNMINWDIEKKLRISDPRVLRDADWHIYSCTTGYPVIGPWTNMENGTQLNAVHRSNYRDFLLTGDSRGRVRLYKYPCAATKPEYRGVKLYSNDVTAANFLYDDMNVITSGGSSPVLALWAVVDAFVSS